MLDDDENGLSQEIMDRVRAKHPGPYPVAAFPDSSNVRRSQVSLDGLPVIGDRRKISPEQAAQEEAERTQRH